MDYAGSDRLAHSAHLGHCDLVALGINLLLLLLPLWALQDVKMLPVQVWIVDISPSCTLLVSSRNWPSTVLYLVQNPY